MSIVCVSSDLRTLFALQCVTLNPTTATHTAYMVQSRHNYDNYTSDV